MRILKPLSMLSAPAAAPCTLCNVIGRGAQRSPWQRAAARGESHDTPEASTPAAVAAAIGGAGAPSRRPRPQVFRFRHFQLDQARAAHKMGTDAMLLGAWAHPGSARRCLDVGTGCGVLALMVAQRARPDALIDAIDVDADAAEQAAANAAACPWRRQLRVRHASLRRWAAAVGPGAYDLVVSNPPYFANSSKPDAAARAAARHADVALPFTELADTAAALLAPPHGRLALVLPTLAGEAEAFGAAAQAAGLLLRRQLSVFTRQGDALPKRQLMEFGLRGADTAEGPTRQGEAEAAALVLNERRFVEGLGRVVPAFTDAYRELTSEFHPPEFFSY